jgi:2-(1,2-epoxy-1,2-dihydrophenyl)acetyl-CoA isomerase
MTYETILFDLADGTARITLNRPEKLNSFNVKMHSELADALGRVEASGEARVLLITGAGRGFCAGQDLSDRAVAPAGPKVDLGESLEKYYNPLIRRLVALPMPVVCAVNGVAAGAGANIAFAADIVLAASSAKFIQSFAQIGLVPDSGGTWILPRLVGQARALGLALTAQPITAPQAEEWGLIWRAVADDQLAAEAEALVTRFATAPTAGLAAIKRLIRSSGGRDLNGQLQLELETQRQLGLTADYAEGVAAFMEKRHAKFSGH